MVALEHRHDPGRTRRRLRLGAVGGGERKVARRRRGRGAIGAIAGDAGQGAASVVADPWLAAAARQNQDAQNQQAQAQYQ
jgi:hypothetical protein